MKKIIIMGAGGFCVEVLWVIQEMNKTGQSNWNVVGILDDNPDLRGEKILDVEVLGTSDDAGSLLPEQCYFHCALGKNKDRARLAEKLESKGFKPATLIHPTVVIAPNVSIGDGVFVGALSIIGPEAKIGDHVLMNTHVGIGHHSEIADYSQICPAVYVNGDCKVGKMAFIGSNATLQPGITVGASSSVGANSFVHRSVKPEHTVVGVPARIISRPAKRESHAK